MPTMSSTLGYLPYLGFDGIGTGFLRIEPFGVIVVLGIMFGMWLMPRRAEKYNLDQFRLQGLAMACIVVGFVGAHVFDVLFYQMDKLKEDPILIFKIWAGISSYGGLLGGIAGFYYYVKRYKLPIGVYADVILWGFLPAFTIGRIACTVVLDHPGAATKFQWATSGSGDTIKSKIIEALKEDGFSAQAASNVWQDYGIHNLGFYELIYLLGVIAVIVILDRIRQWPHGFLVGATAILYAPVRYWLDYFRPVSSDPRHLGLTFAQWTSIGLLVAGVIIIVAAFRTPKEKWGPLPKPETPDEETSKQEKKGKVTAGMQKSKQKQKKKKR